MNGFTISLITYACFLLFSYKFGWFSATIIYDNYGALATWVLIFSALFSVYLLVSGLSSGRVRTALKAFNGHNVANKLLFYVSYVGLASDFAGQVFWKRAYGLVGRCRAQPSPLWFGA
jgi:hypothetical protein